MGERSPRKLIPPNKIYCVGFSLPADSDTAAGVVAFAFFDCDRLRRSFSASCCSISSGLNMASVLSRESGCRTMLCNRVVKWRNIC